ncbi:lamin tail domain-containing protein [Nanoarchaeota archaeon]
MLSKKLIPFLTILLVPMTLAVQISEVYYDPMSETGGEVLELFNPSDSSVDIGGWTVMTESSITDATVPLGTSMPPHSYFLIADSGFSTTKDNPEWPDADYEEPLSMTNTDAGVAIVSTNGTIIDAVGWGDSLNIDPGLFQGTPSDDAPEGSSLQRQSSSGNNSADYSIAAPDLRNSNYTSEGGSSIPVQVEVSSSNPIVQMTITDDDNPEPGIQILPVPGDNKTVTVQANITDHDGIGDITGVIAYISGVPFIMTQDQVINSTTVVYTATIDMQFSDPAGQYTIIVNASDSSSTTSGSDSFEYLPVTAFEIDSTSLSFVNAKPGSSSEILGDYDLQSQAPTIRNIGNINLDMSVYGTDLTSGQNEILISNLRYSFDNDFGSSLSGSISKIAQPTTLGLQPADTISLAFELSVPQATQNGNYTGQVFLAAVGE